MPAPTQAQLTAAGKQAIKDTVAALTVLGKAELVDAAQNLDRWVPAVARWELERVQARAVGDDGKLDELDRNLELLAADAAFALASVGVLAQAEGEKVVGALLSLIGKVAVGVAMAV